MKVASRGPIVRWSLRNPTSGVVVSRSDWCSGRDLSSDERQSGLLFRLRDLCGTTSLEQLPLAVVKAHPSDFQVNEIDSCGNTAQLESAPKGKWRKISRQKTILVEDDTRTPFGDSQKTFSPRVQSYGEYIKHLGNLPKNAPALRFVLYRDSYSLSSVENRLEYLLSMQPDSIFLHDLPGGSFGCFTQHGFCLGMTKELLPHASRHYNIRPLIFDPREYYESDKLDFLQQRPSGHFYRVLLRCVDGDQISIMKQIKRASSDGFVNYFGIENFGVGENKLFEMASLAARGDFRRVVGTLLHSVAEYDGVHHDYYIRYLNADIGTATGITQSWVDAARHMRSQKWLVKLLEGLVKYHQDTDSGTEHLRKIWESLPFRDRIRKSAAEFVWNAMASQRLMSKGVKVVEGDLVRVLHRTSSSFCAAVETTFSCKDYKLVTKEEADLGIYHITDVVLPIPYGITAVNSCLFPHLTPFDRQLYEEFSKKHNLFFLFEEPLLSSTTPQLLYRPLVVKPAGLQVSVIKDPNSFTSLNSDLFLMQQRKPIHTKDMDYNSRVREPCVYNVSERFVEKMEPIQKVHKGKNSVVVSCCLPDGSSPLVMLRECFSLCYASFHDLYGVM